MAREDCARTIIIIIIIIIITIIIIVVIIIISFMQGIYTYIPEANYVPREYSVASILLLLLNGAYIVSFSVESVVFLHKYFTKYVCSFEVCHPRCVVYNNVLTCGTLYLVNTKYSVLHVNTLVCVQCPIWLFSGVP